MKILKITLGLIASMLTCLGISKAQTFDFYKAPIAKVIQKFEATTAYRFNYNPNSIHPFSYTGKLFLDKMQATLAAIESQTPLQFEQHP